MKYLKDRNTKLKVTNIGIVSIGTEIDLQNL